MNKQHDQTKNGDYEDISYYVFLSADYDRSLSWKAGAGSVHIDEARPQKADTVQKDVPVPRGCKLLVKNATVKLVRKT